MAAQHLLGGLHITQTQSNLPQNALMAGIAPFSKCLEDQLSSTRPSYLRPVALTTTTASFESKSVSTSTNKTATTLPGVTSVPTASVPPAPKNYVAGRNEDLEMWMMAGTGFVTAAANVMWNRI